MPFIGGLDTNQNRLVNASLAQAFFPRFQESIFPRLTGSIHSNAGVEPFAAIGAVGVMTRFSGFAKKQTMKSYGANIPNQLFKLLVALDRSDIELDQTGALMGLANAGGIGQRLGARLAQHPEFLFVNRLLTGSTLTRSVETFKGTSYNLTLDGKRFFDQAHPDAKGGTQSNIIQGALPSTAAGIVAQSVAATAKQLQQDLNAVIKHFKTLKDDQGVPLFPSFDAKKHLSLVMPSILEQAATLAFRTDGNALIDQTTGISPLFVKEVLSTGLVEAAPNVIDEQSTGTISPLNETDYYIIFSGDITQALYMQYHSPLTKPITEGGSDPVAQLAEAYKNMGADINSAAVLASTSIDSTLGKVGANSDAYTIQNEEFLLAPRWRGNCFYGPWMNAARVIPVGGTAQN